MKPAVALDTRVTSHMSVGMVAYARALAERLPRIAPDLRFTTFGGGDNFDLAEQIAMPVWIARNRPALTHFLAPYAPLAVPGPYVVTIHDLIELRFPQYAKRRAALYYSIALRRIARRAARVITDDVATAADLERFYGVRPDRIAVVALGSDPLASVPIARETPYVIYAGNRRPHKDLRTLHAAWLQIDRAHPLDLVLTGPAQDDLGAGRAGAGRVVFLGDPGHRDVLRWIAGARALVHPALAEGFGLPLLEAMQLGTPVIATDSCVPAVLRPHARLFPAGDSRALARAIEAELATPNRANASAVRAATAVLTWDRCARKTADVYRAVLAE